MLSLGLAFALALALALVWSIAGPPIAQAADPPLALSVEAAPPMILPGETALYTLTLQNNSDGPIANIVMSATLSGPVANATLALDKDMTGGVNTAGLQRRGNALRWRGGIAKGGKLVVTAEVRGFYFEADGLTDKMVLNAKVGRFGQPTALEQSAEVTVQTATLDSGKVGFAQSFADAQGNPIAIDAGDSISILTGKAIIARVVLSNNTTTPILGVIEPEFDTEDPGLKASNQAQAAGASATENLAVCKFRVLESELVEGTGSQIVGDFDGNGPVNGIQGDTGLAFLAAVAPGARAVVEARLMPTGGLDCQIGGQGKAYLKALPAGASLEAIAPSRRLVTYLRQQNPLLTKLIVLLVLASDFGDAPDSTNHFAGTPMTAYFAPVTQGNFPTVFDPATGAPPGPKHKWVRPLFLGRQVSLELSPDLGPGRNLDPIGDTANLDIRDDGLNLAAAAFGHCLPTTIPFEVTFTQAVIDRLNTEGKKAYLNIWIDGNRDGAWDDILDCDGIQATEHIVIDQAVLPASGGVYNLLAPTRNLPIPLALVGKDMWLRATLSDEPSVKIGTVTSLGQVINYGDGRGPAGGFRFGETEDYIVNAAGAGSGRGADLALDSEVVLWRDLEPSLGSAAGDALNSNLVLNRIRLRNLGGLPNAGTLVIETSPYLGTPTTGEVKCCTCLTCTVASALAAQIELAEATVTEQLPFKEVCDGNNNCRLELPLSDLPPGEEAELLLRWRRAVGQDVDFKVSVQSAATDTNPANNTVQTNVLRALDPIVITYPPPGVFNAPPTATVISGAATNLLQFEIQLFGSAEPNSTIELYFKDSVRTAVNVDAKGFWKSKLAVPVGDVALYAAYKSNAGAAAAEIQAVKWLDASSPYLALVRTGLPFNPASLALDYPFLKPVGAAENDDSGGPWKVVDATGRAEPDGWLLPVVAGEQHAFSVQLTCAAPGATAKLKIGSSEFPLTGPNADGRHTVLFSLPEVNDEVLVEFAVTCDGVESTYTGALAEVKPSVVWDTAGQNPLSGAEVTLWRFVRSGDGVQAIPWQAQAYGQVNPQITGDDGEFTFIAPPGLYGLTVTRDGYQSFRYGPFRLRGALPPLRIGLPPLPAAGEVQDLQVTEEGFVGNAWKVEEGESVRLVNLSLGYLQIDTIEGEFISFEEPEEVSAAAAPVLTTGLLAPGESYTVNFAKMGSFTLVNADDPAQTATIVVETPSPGGVYLPITISGAAP
jgi:uncharacterized repeat protein (TIGR01451 family)